MRKQQGQQPQRSMGSQSSMRGNRGNQQSQRFGQSYDQQSDLYEGATSGSRSGMQSASYDDSYESGRGYRDNDYDLDGSTYDRSDRSMSQSQRGMKERSPSYMADSSNDYDSQRPSSFSSDEERYEGGFGRGQAQQSSRGNGMSRQGASSERFGYPSNMNSWSGADRSFNSGSTGRMGQSSWGGTHEQDYSTSSGMGSGMGMESQSQSFGGSYGESSMGRDSQKGHFGKGPKGYKRSDDRIKEEVCEVLARNPRIDASDIEVSVDDACVTLSGTIDSRETRRAAEMAIENLSGVDDVKNEIRVKKADSSASSSSDSSFGSSSSQASKSGKTAGTTGTSSKNHI